jgi:hypothetical protein
MRKLLLMLLFLMCIVCATTSCTNADDTPTLSYGYLSEGDMLFEDFEVIKVNERTVSSLYSYEVVDKNSNVVYLYTYWSNGNATTCTMTPLYNPDGTVRIYGGK